MRKIKIILIGTFLLALLIALILPRIGLISTAEKDPMHTIRVLAFALHSYKDTYGTYPKGSSNCEIINYLNGGNSKKLLFIDINNKLDKNGDYIDEWETPLKFEFKDNKILIISAGPNREFGDEDDISNK